MSAVSTPRDLSVPRDLSIPHDLSVAVTDMPPPDFAAPLRGAYDLAWTSCAGTPLANTCVEKFFQSFASCFAPSGACTRSIGNTYYCDWASGTKVTYNTVTVNGPWGISTSWSTSSDATCMGYFPAGNEEVADPALTVDVYCLGSVSGCWNRDMGTVGPNGLSCDGHGCTCPDGTHVDNVRPSDCPLIGELLEPDLYLCPHSGHPQDLRCQ